MIFNKSKIYFPVLSSSSPSLHERTVEKKELLSLTNS